jgi:hypothetical protein
MAEAVVSTTSDWTWAKQPMERIKIGDAVFLRNMLTKMMDDGE